MTRPPATKSQPPALRTGVRICSGLFLVALLSGCAAPTTPEWIDAFGYAADEVFPIEIGRFGYPYVPVTVGDQGVTLPFDTGNMVGISLSSRLFDELGLEAAVTYHRRDSAGKLVGVLRVSTPREVSLLGRDLGARPIHELDDPSLPGLMGPDFLGNGHFTLDYHSRLMALSDQPLPEPVADFRPVPLVRSSRHPTLTLVRGTIEDREVLIELDTGKSRTVIHPALASELNLKRGSDGVAIQRLVIGGLSFGVPSAKEVDQSAIDPTLPEPILAGVGSDLLSRFVWTVDYASGLLWIPSDPETVDSPT